MVHRRLGPEGFKHGLWHLGRYGLIVNILSALYLTVSIIFSFFPPTLPVTAENMNWSPVLFPFFVVAGLVYYRFRASKIWIGPIQEDVNKRAVRRLDPGAPSAQAPVIELQALG